MQNNSQSAASEEIEKLKMELALARKERDFLLDKIEALNQAFKLLEAVI